jgi:eukaryotic-like serine/threonine-protein kinase
MGATASVSSTPSDSAGASFELQRGMRLGRYELLHRIASGGMAQVWVARQTGDFGFARTCAVKVIRPELANSRSFRSMFLDEARLAARIRHPHVVEVFDLGESGPTIFQAMELVEGDSLAGLLRGARAGSAARLDAGMVARIMSDMASGLHAAHELRDEAGNALHLVHRDISPQNILVSLNGIAKIADFGVAKALGRLTDETDAGQLKGKFSYLSPEQANRKAIDRRSDIFACGIVLWEALTRKRLFRGDDALDTLARVLNAEVVDPREHVPQIPAPIAEVTMRALSRAPEERPQTAAELSDAIEHAATSAGVAVSARQLAVVLQAGIGERVERQRSAIAQAATEITRATAPTSSPVTPTARRSRRAAVIGIGGVAFAAIATSLFFARQHPAAVEGTVVVSTVQSVAASAAVTSAAVVTPSATPEPSAKPPATTASSSAKPASVPGRHRVIPATSASAGPRLPFGNPY